MSRSSLAREPFGSLASGRLLVEPLLVQSAPNLGGLASTPLGIPVSPSLIGVAIYQQGIVPSPSANPLGLAVTNGGEGCIGL